MNRNRNNSGFSLIEVLIATGILAIGLVMVATIFPVGVKLTTLTTEHTIGAVVADEAFAKIQLYGLRDFQYWPSAQINTPAYADPTQTTYETCDDYQYLTVYAGPDGIVDNGDETLISYGPDGLLNTGDDIYLAQYPSTVVTAGQEQNYYWSAICRRVGLKDVQITVFVSRKIAAGAQYHSWNYTPLPTNSYSANSNSIWPVPIQVNVFYNPAFPQQLSIIDGPDTLLAANSQYFFDDGFTIVDNCSGRIYRVLEVRDVDGDGVRDIILMENWQPTMYSPNDTIWVVPPAVGSDRYPCVGVYQKVIRFDDIN